MHDDLKNRIDFLERRIEELDESISSFINKSKSNYFSMHYIINKLNISIDQVADYLIDINYNLNKLGTKNE